jgi:hypothetical protein
MPGEPVCSVIVFCDLIIVEQMTGKNSLIGTFANLASAQFPLVVEKFFVHASISNVAPTQTPIAIATNLKQKDSGMVLGSTGFTTAVPFLKNQPLPPSGIQINLNVPFQRVAFPAPGVYECEILFDGSVIGSRMLDVVYAQPPQLNPPQNPV